MAFVHLLLVWNRFNLQASLECVSIVVQTTQEYDMQEHRYKAVVINVLTEGSD